MTNAVKKDFPILLRPDAHGRTVAFLDNAATTQKPEAVIQAIGDYYRAANSNPHRGVYDLSVAATAVMDSVREKVRAFIGAKRSDEIIFTKGATESLNLVARGYGGAVLKPGDTVAVLISEHHSNLIPWQQVTRAAGASLVYLYTDAAGRIPSEEIAQKITGSTKIVAAAHISNVTGIVNPIEAIIERAHQVGAVVVVDGTQSAPHMPVDVSALDADFFAFSAHKMLGPMGVGVLYGKAALLEATAPLLYGGDMIEYVEEQTASFASSPEKFEGGTQNAGGIAGFGAAIDYLNRVGMENLHTREREMTAYLMEKLQSVPRLSVIGPANPLERIGVASFVIEGVHPHDIATILNADSVAIRSGHHCAQPFMRYLGVQSTSRASVYLYNTFEDIDRMTESLKTVRRWLGYGT